MQRRDFIKTSALASAAAILPWGCVETEFQPKFKLGYQLYSIRDEMQKDPLATLKALKAMGYQDFETYGFELDTNTIYGFAPEDLKDILAEMELTVSSGHYDFNSLFEVSDAELQNYVAASIKAAKTIDNSYITWPFIAEPYRNREGYELLAKKLNMIGKQVSEAGLGFAFHNHGYEFADVGGLTGYDIIADQTNPDWVKFQMDMYWVEHQGKTSPKELIAKYPGRYVMWHIKDMHKESRDYTELGNGSIDYHSVLPDPDKSGLEYFYIEQGGNYSISSMESAKFSAAYFKKELQQYL